MEKVKTAILAAILIFTAGTLVKLFDFNSNLISIENKLDKSKEDLEKVLDSISTAKEEIDTLLNKIDSIKKENVFYQFKRDSLVKVFGGEIENHEIKLAELKEQQESAKGKLKYLREENDKFK